MRSQLPVRSIQFGFPISISKCAMALLCCAFSIEPLFAQEVDWPYYGADVHNTRFANIDQINPSNISQLKPAWTFHTGVNPNLGMEMTPIVVDGVMYITASDDEVFALNPTTGAQIWKYTPTDMPPLSTLAYTINNRGVAYGQGLIFDARMDAKLVALNSHTGKVVWETTVDLPSNKAGMTLAPQYIRANGGTQPEVIVGVTLGEAGVRGHLDAYNPATGKLLWRFWTTEPNTWGGEAYLHGGGAIWATPSFDPTLNMVYVGTGNASGSSIGPSDVLGGDRPGVNLYTNSAVALDATTGELQWFFQTTHHDLWDSDLGQPTVLFNWNGIPAIGFTPKSGWTWILDRASGESLFPYQEVAIPTAADAAFQKPWPTQPISSIDSLVEHMAEPGSLPAGMAAAPPYATPGTTAMVRQPSIAGAVDWPPAAYSPRTNFLYSHAYYEPEAWGVTNNVITRFCEATSSVPGYWSYCGISAATGGSPLAAGAGLPGVNHGVYGAINTVTGKIAWTIPVLTSTPYSGMAVAGDLVFFGDSSGLFYAASAATGEILWVYDASIESNTGGADASPAIYEVGGVEYVVYPFGGNPATISTLGDAVIAFALPSSVAAAKKSAAAKARTK
jgi:PQQ-dependent dehydrogenase (methanol/ethanol family)